MSALRLVAGLCLGLLLAGFAQAGKFSISEADARRQLFPDATGWEPVDARALATALREIGSDPGVTMVAARLVVLKVRRGDAPLGYFVTDQVIGKFEKIDYAVALAPAGDVQRVLVMKYRESHGHEVAEEPWISQFAGRNAHSPLKVGKDVDGITGATLSAVHVSEGVRRVTRLVEALKKTGG